MYSMAFCGGERAIRGLAAYCKSHCIADGSVRMPRIAWLRGNPPRPSSLCWAHESVYAGLIVWRWFQVAMPRGRRQHLPREAVVARLEGGRQLPDRDRLRRD